MPSVVIVGRGASLLQRKLGQIIDSYDVVIRVNHDPTLPEHTGVKTTIFSSRVVSKIQKFSHIIERAGQLWVCDSQSESYNNVLPNVPVTFMTDSEIVSLLPNFAGYGNNVRSNDGRFSMCVPDTGIATIHCALQRFPDSSIGVCGIDLYAGGNLNITREEDISSIFKMPVLLQTLYYKKLVHLKKIHEVWNR